MLKQNIAVKSFKFVLRDVIFDIIYWPIWWYSSGTIKAWQRMKNIVSAGNVSLGLSIWIKNIFKPMFGQQDWQGRLISFFLRLVQIIFRLIVFLGWIVFAVFSFLFWLAMPIFLIFEFIFNLGLFS